MQPMKMRIPAGCEAGMAVNRCGYGAKLSFQINARNSPALLRKVLIWWDYFKTGGPTTPLPYLQSSRQTQGVIDCRMGIARRHGIANAEELEPALRILGQ